jgi:hypothetical protein
MILRSWIIYKFNLQRFEKTRLKENNKNLKVKNEIINLKVNEQI